MGLRFGGESHLLLTFYGDDFTGSTDAMEGLAMAGVPTVLFLSPPDAEQIARYPGIAAVGVAGTSRSRTPDWMDRELPGVFRRLRNLGAPLCHYKTCSTFDSAPTVGSIGRAAEIGGDVFGGAVLVLVGVARHKRFVVFSNLFAAASFSGDQEIFRIDRHPTMSHHPVTPMSEGDLRRHLACQTSRRITGFDFLKMQAGDADTALDRLMTEEADLVILDTFDEATTRVAGRLIAGRGAKQPTFLVGSSGVEYALTEHLTQAGLLPLQAPPGPARPSEKLAAVCGSCSPVTEAQIQWAEANGYALVGMDTVKAVGSEGNPEFIGELADTAASALETHVGVILHTARGREDPRIAQTLEALSARGSTDAESSAVLGGICGQVLRDIVAKSGIRRVVLAGGDSSSYAAQTLGIEAMEVVAPLVPGAPLCRAHAADPVVDGLEIVLKGGQVGDPGFFSHVLQGRVEDKN